MSQIDRNNTTSVRVMLVWVDAEEKDAKLDSQIMIDLIIDLESKRPKTRMPFFGLHGSPVREECYPFVLKPDGVVDYGHNSETEKAYVSDTSERYAQCNILSREIVVGEFVTYTDSEGEWTYRIQSVG